MWWSTARTVYRIFFVVACLFFLTIGIWIFLPSEKTMPVSNPATPTQSNIIEFNPQVDRNIQMFNGAMADGRACMYGTMRSYLYMGLRNRDEIVKKAADMCVPSLVHAYSVMGRPIEEAVAYLSAVGYDQLDAIIKSSR